MHMDTITLYSQYEICIDFISKLREGCPSVTAIIGKYPKLIDVIIAISRSPGVRSNLQGKYQIQNYAEPFLRKQCMESDLQL